MTDWATDLIVEISDLDDDATRAFCAAYADGDSIEAADKFAAAAVREVWHGSYVEYTFPDGSRYRDSNQGIDRFYPPGFGRDDRDIEDDEPWIDGNA
jgi:hypothetical protein